MTYIQRLNGPVIDLDDLGIRTRDVIISSPNYIHETEQNEGGLGLIDYGSEIGPREITLNLRATSKSIKGFSLLRDEIFDIFQSMEPFYLIEKRIKGKRWLVKVNSAFSIPQRLVYGNFDVELVGLNGIAESVGTTMDIHNGGIDAESGLWSAGMGLIADAESKNYRLGPAYQGQKYRIYNPGNLPVYPFLQDLKIEIRNVLNSTEMFQITNQTNGSRARINVPVNSGDVIVYDGPEITRNGLAFFRSTRRDYIELDPGWNELEIYYCDSARVEFDFRAYYK